MSTSRPPTPSWLPAVSKSTPRSSRDAAGGSLSTATIAGSVSPITTADDGSTIPAFSRAMSSSVGPANSVWSMPMLVITATWAETTLVASQRPSRPTSTTATSTAMSANQRNAAAVHASKYDGRTPVNPSRSATAAICSAKSSSPIGSALLARRSFTRSRCGLVYVPTLNPWAINRRVTICAVGSHQDRR